MKCVAKRPAIGTESVFYPSHPRTTLPMCPRHPGKKLLKNWRENQALGGQAGNGSQSLHAGQLENCSARGTR